MRLFILSFFLIALSFGAQAQEQAQEQEMSRPGPEVRMDQFFGMLKDGDVDRALRTLFDGSFLGEDEEKVNYMIDTIETGLGTAGVLTSHELYLDEQIGASILHLTYLSHHKYIPFYWNVFFYKPEDEWTVIKIRFSDNQSDLIPLKY